MIPSLLQIPSAVSDSKLHSVLPNNGKGDFTFDRSTGATRINKDGLIEEVGYFSSELVQNGDFSELGSEIITNGDFASNSDWTLTGATINAGKVNVNSTSPIYIIQNSVATIGKTYRVELTVSDYVSGDLRLRYPFTKSESEFTGNGTYVFYGVAVDARVELQGRFSGQTYDYKIDNVSVKQVDPNNRWTLGTGWSYGTNKAEKTAGTGSILSQSNVVEANKKYKVSFDVVATAGYIDSVFIGGQSEGTNITASGSYSYIFDTTNTDNLGFNANSAFAGSVTNISVVEVQGDRPRLSYDITNGVVEDKPHLLLEPSSSNVVVNSKQTNTWTYTEFGSGSAGTITTSFTDMMGETNAIKVDYPANADNAVVRFGSTTDSLTSGTATYSMYIKLVEAGSKVLQIRASTGILQTITVNSTEFKRYSVTGTKNSNEAISLIVRPAQGTSSGGFSVVVCCPQGEAQSYATSYIPTAGTVISRASETCNNSKPSVNSTEGVLYAEIAALADNQTYRNISISDGVGTNAIRMNFNITSNRISSINRVGNSNTAFINYDATDITQYQKVAFKFKVNDFAVYANGTVIGTDTSGAVNSAGALTTLNFDQANGGSPFYGKVKGLAVYNEALTDAQLIELTS
jgi:hypothetical protein